VPVFRHKDAWAEEKTAPLVKEEDFKETSKLATARLVGQSRPMASNASSSSSLSTVPKEILIVASKLKDYIRVKSGMNTSANVLDRLSDMIRLQCDKAIERAQSDSRKTVMDRDFHW
jgi:hypothetical protein